MMRLTIFSLIISAALLVTAFIMIGNSEELGVYLGGAGILIVILVFMNLFRLEKPQAM